MVTQLVSIRGGVQTQFSPDCTSSVPYGLTTHYTASCYRILPYFKLFSNASYSSVIPGDPSTVGETIC